MAKMKKTLLLFMFLFLILVGCSGNNIDVRETPTSINHGKLEEDKVVHEEYNENAKIVDLSGYNYKIPDVLIAQNNKDLLNRFDEIKNSFYQNDSKEYASQNGRFDATIIESGYNKEKKFFIIMVLFVNTSGRDINNVDFNFDIYLKGKSFPQIKDKTLKITKKITGGIPPNTIMPFAIRYDDLDLDIETENFISTDMIGSDIKKYDYKVWKK